MSKEATPPPGPRAGTPRRCGIITVIMYYISHTALYNILQCACGFKTKEATPPAGPESRYTTAKRNYNSYKISSI